MPSRTIHHILATGQTECFDAAGRPTDCMGSGQNGEFRTGVPWPVPRFDLLESDLALDRLTGQIGRAHV